MAITLQHGVYTNLPGADQTAGSVRTRPDGSTEQYVNGQWLPIAVNPHTVPEPAHDSSVDEAKAYLDQFNASPLGMDLARINAARDLQPTPEDDYGKPHDLPSEVMDAVGPHAFQLAGLAAAPALGEGLGALMGAKYVPTLLGAGYGGVSGAMNDGVAGALQGAVKGGVEGYAGGKLLGALGGPLGRILGLGGKAAEAGAEAAADTYPEGVTPLAQGVKPPRVSTEVPGFSYPEPPTPSDNWYGASKTPPAGPAPGEVDPNGPFSDRVQRAYAQPPSSLADAVRLSAPSPTPGATASTTVPGTAAPSPPTTPMVPEAGVPGTSSALQYFLNTERPPTVNDVPGNAADDAIRAQLGKGPGLSGLKRDLLDLQQREHYQRPPARTLPPQTAQAPGAPKAPPTTPGVPSWVQDELNFLKTLQQRGQ